jgi:alkylhydroperoxidase/carboxymuconolactone decarboxylase family protein YurZ
MSFIQSVPEPDATGKLRDLYETERATRGYVPNHVKALSLRPDVIEAWQRLISVIRAPMEVRRYELVTIAAAAALRCSY